jgi:ABC-2 type transport system ATP-binding protein
MNALPSEAAIKVEMLSKSFGDFVAVDKVSFAVPRGEVFGFLGPNGAGKTTTIRMLLGLLAPTSGQAQVLGYVLPRQAKDMHGRVGYMSQAFTLYDDLTARENIRFYGLAFGLGHTQLRQREETILAMAGLASRANERTSGLSGGWRQRLALGCAIIHRPELVFLDEPTAGVDPVSRRQFWRLIYDLAQEGTTVFVTTHYMDEAEHCQRLGFVSQGRLVALGSPAALKSARMRGQVLEVRCDDAESAVQVLRQARLAGRLVADEVALYGATLHVVVPDPARGSAEVQELLCAAALEVRAIVTIAPSLEDVFISCVRESRGRAASD